MVEQNSNLSAGDKSEEHFQTTIANSQNQS